MIGYYRQDEQNPDHVLVCPMDGSELLVSEYGERYVCEAYFHDVAPYEAVTRAEYRAKHPDRVISTGEVTA